jgi:AcrR family transcriptional regulator
VGAEPGKRKRRRPGEARELLLNAARELFAERGFANTSTREVADRAGVAEGLLFRHFGSKAKLFVESVLEPFNGFVDEFVETYRAQRDAPRPVAELHHEYVEHLYDVVRQNRRLFLSVIAAATFEPDAFPDLEQEFSLSDPLDRLRFIGEEEIERRHLRHTDLDVNIRAVVAMVAGLALLDPWIMPRGSRHPSRRRVVDEVVAISLYGHTDPARSTILD